MSPDLVRKPLHYDRALRRLWIRGQRCHHGATGAVLATASLIGLAAARLRAPAAFAGVLAAGGILMAHDWQDRSLWFARGWQDQTWTAHQLPMSKSASRSCCEKTS